MSQVANHRSSQQSGGPPHRGKLLELNAYIVTSQLPEHVGKRGADSVNQFMKSVGRSAEVILRDQPALDLGAAVVISAKCERGCTGFTSLGERGKPIERVAQDACQDFMKWWKSGAACEEHLSDQLAMPAALANGESRWSIPTATEHLRTALWVVSQFLEVESTITEDSGSGCLVTVQSRGLQQ